MNILVIGDSCSDIFRYGKVNRIAPEAPVPIITPNREISNPGMAGNVAVNLKALGANVDLITNSEEIRKIRYVCSKYNYLLLRIDENDVCDPLETIEIEAKKYDAIVISDYCKGFLKEDMIEAISNTKECPVFLDTKKILGDWCKHIDFIKINHQEFLNNNKLIEMSPNLQNKTIVTRGKYGCDFKNKNYPTIDVPVKDVSGAGDTFLAGLVVEYVRSKFDIEKAINFAQECTTKVIQKSGVSTI